MNVNITGKNRKNILSLGFLFLLVTILFGSLVNHLIKNSEPDFIFHINLASKMLVQKALFTPHFLFPLTIIFLHILIPEVGFQTLGMIIVVSSYLFLTWILFSFFRNSFRIGDSYKISFVCVLYALALMIIGPITLFYSDNPYLGYVGISVYHNPTMTLLKPLALLLFIKFINLWQSPKENYGNCKESVLFLTALTIISTMAKPSFIICFLPSILIFLLLSFIKKEKVDWRSIALGIIVPAILILIWQYIFTYRSNPSGQGIVFAPFKVIHFYSGNILPKFFLSVLFPICVYLFYWNETKNNFVLNFSWLLFLIGASYQYLFAEPARLYDANLFWSAQICLFILFVMSLHFFAKKMGIPGDGVEFKKNGKKNLLVLTILFLHIISGISWYWIQFSKSQINLWS